MDGLISSGLRTHKKLQPSKDGTAAFLVLIYPEKAYFHCPDLPGSHSKSTHIIFHIQKTVPPSASNRLFMWRQSRNFWFAEICVIHKNPLSERSELWIFANAFSRFRQALKFRPAATESRLDADGGTSCEIFYLISPQVHSHLHKPHPQKAA